MGSSLPSVAGLSTSPIVQAFKGSPLPPFSMMVCVDAEGWLDSLGDSCYVYKNNNFCTEDGQPGIGWSVSWGSLSDWSVNGLGAHQACCTCGGGMRTTTSGDATP